jgi:hypothetical protein
MKKPASPSVHSTPSHVKRSPRLPHERDESTDSQSGDHQPVIEQAGKDIARGLVDTDRGPLMDTPLQRARERQEEAKAVMRGARP